MTHPTLLYYFHDPPLPPVDFMNHPPHPTLLISWPTPPYPLTFLDPYFVVHHPMYFSNDKIVRKNFFITSIITLPFGRQQSLLGLFHFFGRCFLKMTPVVVVQLFHQPLSIGGGGLTYWHWRWKDAGHRSQHSRSPPSLQLSQQSWFTNLAWRRYSLRSRNLGFFTGCELSGGATNRWISCYNTHNKFIYLSVHLYQLKYCCWILFHVH